MSRNNKLLLFFYTAFIVLLSTSSDFLLFILATIIALFVAPKARKLLLALRAVKATLFFSGLTFAGALAASLFFATAVDYPHFAALFCRAATIAFLTLSVVDRIGIFTIFSFKSDLSMFFVLLFTKIESLQKEMQDFKEAAQSRGVRASSMKESLWLLSVIATALLLKSVESFRASAEALKSRGYKAYVPAGG